jgi:hypothetical protein
VVGSHRITRPGDAAESAREHEGDEARTPHFVEALAEKID